MKYSSAGKVGEMIKELLHTGIENALSPEYLSVVTGLGSIRAVQKQIERERREGAVIFSSTVPPAVIICLRIKAKW